MARQAFSSSEGTILLKDSTDTMQNPKVRRQEKYKHCFKKENVTQQEWPGCNRTRSQQKVQKKTNP